MRPVNHRGLYQARKRWHTDRCTCFLSFKHNRSDQLTEVYDVPFPVLPGAANTHGTPDNSGRLYLAPDGIMVNHHYDCYRQQQEEKKLRNTKKKKKRYRMGEEDEEEEKKKKIC